MSIFKEKERTYEFSLEGLALMKADKNLRNKINDMDSIIFLSVLGITVVGLSLLLTPVSSLVAYKSIEIEASQVAYKVLEVL